MVVVAWSYRVVAGCEPAFEALYGSDGGWARLFARSSAYLGTRLLRDVEDAACYATFDRWRSHADYEAFLRDHREAYAVLDREGDALTCEETRLAVFESEPS